MKGKHDVYIVEVDGKFRVRPAIWSAVHGANFSIKNTTSHQVMVTFTNIEVVEDQSHPSRTLQPLDPQGHAQDDRWDVTLNGKCHAGCYAYDVDVLKAASKVAATGESKPIIIIDL